MRQRATSYEEAHPAQPEVDDVPSGTAAEFGASTPPAAVLPARPILVVEDDMVSALLIRTCLLEARLTNPVITVRDGDQAKAALGRSVSGDGRTPALVLLEGKLPGASGHEVLTWMRLQPSLREVPVVFLTGDDSRASIRAAYAAGAASYLVKPVAFEALGGVIRGLGLPWTLA